MKKEKTMKKRSQLTLFLMILVLFAVSKSVAVHAQPNSDNHETEEEKLEKLRSAAEADDGGVNYFFYKEMALTTGKYDSELLQKKYESIDAHIRFWAQVDEQKPAYYYESELLTKKIGVVDQILTLESGDVVFTLTDNPAKRFLILPDTDWAYQRYLTKPGDTVYLLTTLDRRVYEFDNLDLTRNQQVSYEGYYNPDHPEDMVQEGFFPSQLYKERIEKYGIPNDAIKLFLEYVNPEKEEYYGFQTLGDMEYDPNKDERSFDDLTRKMRIMDEANEEIGRESMARGDHYIRTFMKRLYDWSTVEDRLRSKTDYIRTVSYLNDGGLVFIMMKLP